MIDNAKILVAEFNRAYDEHTELKNICTHSYYADVEEGSERREAGFDGVEEDDPDYYQIGRHTSLPVSLVEDGRFRYVSETVGDALAEGEKTFLAERFDEVADEEGVERTVSGPSSLVSKAEAAVNEPDLVLVPRSERYDEIVAGWNEGGKIRRFGNSEYYVDEETESDLWLHRFDGPESVFVLDTQKVSVVQKKGEATLRPTDFLYDGEAESLNDGKSVSVYFGEEIYPGDGEYEEFFDLLYRVVLSEPVVKDGGLCKVSLGRVSDESARDK